MFKHSLFPFPYLKGKSISPPGRPFALCYWELRYHSSGQFVSTDYRQPIRTPQDLCHLNAIVSGISIYDLLLTAAEPTT